MVIFGLEIPVKDFFPSDAKRIFLKKEKSTVHVPLKDSTTLNPKTLNLNPKPYPKPLESRA